MFNETKTKITNQFSNAEKSFYGAVDLKISNSYTPCIITDTYPNLGLLTSLRFIEWVCENPRGVVSLPTGKTPEYFIKWTNYIIKNWDSPKVKNILEKHGLNVRKKPRFDYLKFVQIDEFYPIDPNQKNSFYYYVKKFYIDGFGLNPKNALLINCDEINKSIDAKLSDIFHNNEVDLDLRNRDPRNQLERTQKEIIFMVDQWCSDYENKIRELGGIGFFLGGIGPDGHIAFNVRGSDHNSTTRLTNTNFETQAAAAIDLGGIEVSRKRLVITIGLSTITFNPNAAVIIMAAGKGKASIVKNSLEKRSNIIYPATVLQKLDNARFYLTRGAASLLSDTIDFGLKNDIWDKRKIEYGITKLCQKLNKYGHHLNVNDLKNDKFCSKIPNLGAKVIQETLNSFTTKIEKGLSIPTGETFLHTGPHHDDIMLGYLPHLIHLFRSPKNTHHFSVLTSGFTSVTNDYLHDLLLQTVNLLEKNKIEMIDYPDFFEKGFKRKKDKDIYHYLDRLAANNNQGQIRGICHRLVRILTEVYEIKSKTELTRRLEKTVSYLDKCYQGQKNNNQVQQIKGMLREFEEELVWSHYGVQVKDISHLRLGFYKGDVFNDQPEFSRDVEPILKLLKELEPTVISMAMDPEGSGPDTHYKVLQSIAEAVRIWGQEKDLSNLKIWGYRNVWYRYDASEADLMIPVSLNSMSSLRETFMTSYLSQKEASFPSHELDGPFCDLAQKVWVEQHELMELVLGRDYWYQNQNPRIRATHGLVFLKELDVHNFLEKAGSLAKLSKLNFLDDN